MIYTYRSERLIPGKPPAVQAAIATVVGALWHGQTHVVAEQRLRRVDAVTVEVGSDEPDVWLTWELAPVAETTRVQLVLDELESGPDATEAMTEVLSLLSKTVAELHPSHGSATLNGSVMPDDGDGGDGTKAGPE